MQHSLNQIIDNEEERRREFPVCTKGVFMAHAGVTALPRCAADAITQITEQGTLGNQEIGRLFRLLAEARGTAAKLIHCHPDEVALLGPTSLGLSLVANGIEWKVGDEIICYHDDYPANVYPWAACEARGVVVKRLKTSELGRIDVADLDPLITSRTRLVALASCHYLSGIRLPVDEIGQFLHSKNILFCLDAIQTLGAAPTSAQHVDFLSADSHKWLLGPLAAGIVMIKKEHFPLVHPTLVGAWNCLSPNFIAQEKVDFEASARRYEPGAMNLIGIAGMQASMEMLLDIGVERIYRRILHLRSVLVPKLKQAGFTVLGDDLPEERKTSIITVTHPTRDLVALGKTFLASGIEISQRNLRDGTPIIRFSPHFYNTEAEIDKIASVMN